MRKNDSNATSFLTTAGITDQTISQAINNLVLDLKAADVWNRCTAIYPMVGGTSTTHSYNLINPAQYQLTFTGGWTHSSTGALPNGTNAYASTGINASTVLTQSSNHLAFYSRTNATAVDGISIGAATGAGVPASPFLALILKYSTNQTFYYNATGAATQSGVASNTDSKGFYIGNKTSAAIGGNNIIKNGTVLNTSTVAVSVNTYPNVNILLSAWKNTGTAYYDNKECAYVSIGTRLASYQYPFYNSIMTNFQTALGRNV
jgi:hypothetical protein